MLCTCNQRSLAFLKLSDKSPAYKLCTKLPAAARWRFCLYFPSNDANRSALNSFVFSAKIVATTIFIYSLAYRFFLFVSVSLNKEMKVTLGISILDRSGRFGNKVHVDGVTIFFCYILDGPGGVGSEVHVDGVVWLLGLCHGVTLGIPIHLVDLFDYIFLLRT